jgi:polyhydroxyalkanoate synthesis regulator protein
MAGALSGGPFADLAKRNMELFTAASGVKPEPAPAQAQPAQAQEDELERLKAQLAELQSKVDKLGK